MILADRHKATVRGFCRCSRAWYGQAVATVGEPERITVGQYVPNGGTTGEYSITWHALRCPAVPRLEVFDDAWEVLHMHADLLAELAKLDNRNATPDEIQALLLWLGFEDLTPVDPPLAARVVRAGTPTA